MPKPNYFAIIPANVRYDNELKQSEKLIYGEITALANKEGYCYANNKYFAKLYDVTTSTVSRWISNLEKRGYVRVEISEKSGNKRKIFLNNARGIDKNRKTPLAENVKTPLAENRKHNNININNTSNNILNNIVPKTEIKKIYDSLPDYWKGIFKGYINIYRKKNKTGKITANRHYKLLVELYHIFQKMRFKFNHEKYKLTPEIFEHGINTIIEKNIGNLNYAKQVWISDIEKLKQKGGIKRGQFSANYRREEKTTEEEDGIFNTG